MIKKGDTLIEVTLAIGIFSMVAVSVVAVMGNGTAGAETALETTLTREEIDAQADALRFIHSSFISDENHEDDRYAKLWDAITKNAIELTDSNKDIVEYSPTTCDALYSKGENNSNPPLYNQGAFVVNTDYLGTYSTMLPNSLNEDVVKNAIISYKEEGAGIPNDKFTAAKTYPHLIYQEGKKLEDESTLTANYNDLARAEGIYVIAVKDPGTEVAGVDAFNKMSAFYDFYIRTCWYGVGDDFPSTISTVIRLYNPDAIIARKIEPEPEPEPDNESMQNIKPESLASKIPNDGDTTTLKDSRDGKEYKIVNIKGQYWMQESLKFTGTRLSPKDSNVGATTTIAYRDFTTEGSYNDAMMHVEDGNVWYNYAAASAMTITGESNSTTTTYDICPYGWSLPRESNFAILQQSQNLLQFDPERGFYRATENKIVRQASEPVYWSALSATNDGQKRYTIARAQQIIIPGSPYFTADRKNYGLRIRCVKKASQSQPIDENPTPTPNTYNLEIVDDNSDFDMDLAVAAVYIREGSPTGTIIDCPGGSGHFVCYNLKEGNDYYLYPAFNPGHEFSFWLQTDSVSGARLGDSHTQNTYYKAGGGHGQLYIFTGS